jgi:hypothetical protein
MKKISLVFLFCIFLTDLFAQKETFDLATYTIPKGWNIVSKTADLTGFNTTNNLTGAYCQIALYKSMATMGNAQLDFDTEWHDLVAKTYNVSVKSDELPSTFDKGYEAKSGVAPFEFNGGKAIAMLVTMSGYGKRMSIVILTNTQDYNTEIKDFLGSADFKKPEVSAQPVTNNSGNNTSILGTWGISASDQTKYRVKNAVMNYISRQYTFNANGTYSFITKTFDPFMENILLRKENGTYLISGTSLTVIPEKSVLEGWSKKDGKDEWGKLISSQNIPLENITYQFTKHYFSGIKATSLVLQAGIATLRDGPFSNNSSFDNAWYYNPISANNTAIILPGEQ